ncbi:MAG: hypothetical protein LBT76_00240, partial [Tannerella sp.]|nr:hypothetical protein [Tannerella sp.]
MKEKVKRWGGWILSIVVILIGCKSSETAERTIGGAALEAVGSAVIGGKAGVVISKNIAGQKAELDVVLPQKRAIETVRKGEALKVTFDAGLLFVKNASTLSDTAKYILR